MNNLELNRHEIRESALQALFPLDFNLDLTKEAAIKHALEVNQYELVSEDGESFVPDYLDEVVAGVCSHKDEIDEQITKYLKNWTIGRIAKIDLIILRIATYEIMYVDSIPDKVAVNEAVELTKKYSDEKSRKFVNGVLSNMIR